MAATPATPKSYERGGRSIAWVLKSSDNHKFVLGSCEVDPKMFEENGKSVLPDNKVYVVLDQISNEGKEKNQLDFGLKVVNQDGDELGASGTNALIATESGVGLVNIKGWYGFTLRDGRVPMTEEGEDTLKGWNIFPKFQITASEVDAWLKGGSGIDEGKWGGMSKKQIQQLISERKEELVKSILNTRRFSSKYKFKNTQFDVEIIAEWNSWCGKYENKFDKRIGNSHNSRISEGKGYKNTDVDVKLQVGNVASSRKEDVWAFVPLRKPIVKIKIDPKKINNETIEGTLEPMNDSYSFFI